MSDSERFSWPSPLFTSSPRRRPRAFVVTLQNPLTLFSCQISIAVCLFYSSPGRHHTLKVLLLFDACYHYIKFNVHVHALWRNSSHGNMVVWFKGFDIGFESVLMFHTLCPAHLKIHLLHSLLFLFFTLPPFAWGPVYGHPCSILILHCMFVK